MDSSAQAAPLQPLAIACSAAACILLHLLWYFKSLILAGISRALAELRDDPQVFQTPTGFHLRVTAAPGKGLGIFAVQEIPQGAYLGLYAGELIDDNEFERRYKDLHRQAPKSSMGEGPIGGYVFGLGNGYSMDAEDLRFSNWTRYVNHSSRRPNIVTRCDGRRIEFWSFQRVAAGAELLMDYGPDYVAAMPGMIDE